MNRNHDIEEDEIRIVGGRSAAKRIPRWAYIVAALLLLAVVLLLTLRTCGSGTNPAKGTVPPPADETLPAAEATLWHENLDPARPSCLVVSDTFIDSLHLQIFTPLNALPELHLGPLDTADTTILFAAMAADLRRDNGKIVGAFVMAGEPLSWGLSKRGYCAIIDGRIALGTADNSPLFEQATEQGGYFFRQYPAVADGHWVPNNPENASFRRALCLLDGKVCIVACSDRVLMNDFSIALSALGATQALFLVGGTSDGWYRNSDGSLSRLGTSYARNTKYMNYIVFRKQ